MARHHLETLDAPRIPTATLPGASTTSIHDAINTATRRQHTTLNRLIIDRIPLALPPRAVDPTTYGHGIAVFAQLYFAFEQAWDDVIAADSMRDPNDESREARLLHWLATLRPPGLVRSERLGKDLHDISRGTGINFDEDRPVLERILRRTREATGARPHTLVAYAWVMYMALFSGGRWIRQILSRAGSSFWQTEEFKMPGDAFAREEEQTATLEMPGFSFLFFDDGRDGNTIKAEFKAQLAEGETLLSARERRDIVTAATSLFDDCIALVGLLDEQNQAQPIRRSPFWSTTILGLVKILLGFAAGAAGLSVWLGWPIPTHWPRLIAQRLNDLSLSSIWERLAQRRPFR